MSIIQIKNLTKYYGNNQILDNLNLFVEEGEFISIEGSSGSGKGHNAIFWSAENLDESFLVKIIEYLGNSSSIANYLNNKDIKGRNVLHHLLGERSEIIKKNTVYFYNKMVKKLLELKAINTDEKDMYGKTIYDYALEIVDEDLLSILKEFINIKEEDNKKLKNNFKDKLAKAE